MKTKKRYGTLILAGGKSSRMAFPKPWLTLKNNISFLEHIVKLYSSVGVERIVVVINHEFYDKKWQVEIQNIEKDAIIVKNRAVEKGRIHSIILGLEELKNMDFVFIQNVDNPILDHQLIKKLYKNASEKGVTVPVRNAKGGHPVLISKKIGTYILNENFDLTVTLRDVLAQFDRTSIEVEDENIFMNLNTPSDYKSALSEFV